MPYHCRVKFKMAATVSILQCCPTFDPEGYECIAKAGVLNKALHFERAEAVC